VRIAPAIAALIFGFAALSVATVKPASAAAAWRRAFSEKGVTVHVRDGVGGNMPEFRGTTVVRASTWRVLAVLEDIDATCEWTARCVANRELRRASFTRRWFYHRSDAPWPFADRDAVMLTEVEGLPAGVDVKLRFRRDGDKLLPPVDGVVRMPVMGGVYRVRRIDAASTRVTMQVRMHPGGMIPDWAAKWVSKRIPVDTLSGLRKQVVRTRGRYEAFLNKWDPARRKPIPSRPVRPAPPASPAAP